MDWTLITTIISAAICFGYILTICVMHGVPDSISNSYYLLGKHGWLFTAWSWLTAFTLLPAWIERSGEDFQFIAFLSAIYMIGVGCAPRYLEDDKMLHFCCATTAGSLSVVWCALSGHTIIPMTAIITCSIIGGEKYWLFGAEVAAFLSLYTCMILS